jgi:predicted nuclease with RNAse H fold
MNRKIEIQKKLKDKFKVTVTPNMGVVEVLDAWDRVPEVVKSVLPPEINVMMSMARTALSLLETLRELYVMAVKLYFECKAAIEAASAALTGQMQQPTLLVSTKAAKLAEEAQNMIIYELPNQMIDLLLDQVPSVEL